MGQKEPFLALFDPFWTRRSEKAQLGRKNLSRDWVEVLSRPLGGPDGREGCLWPDLKGDQILIQLVKIWSLLEGVWRAEEAIWAWR